MSFFAGIFSVSNERPAGCGQALESAAALSADFTVSRYSDSHLLLLHGHLAGVLPEAGWSISEGTVTALAGSLHLTTPPTLEDDNHQPELACITSSLRTGRISDLSDANGTFALCFYDRRSHRLILAADCLGGRPLYYASSSDLLFFSTSLAVLKSLEMVPKMVEVASYIEEEALGYPLAGRTIYQDIKVAVANECIIANDGNIVHEKYFDWATAPLAEHAVDELAWTCRRALRDAVACRARPGAKQLSLLSGGLDSRVLVTELLDLGYEVEAINVAREGFQDQIYARLFAEVAGIRLATVPWSPAVIGLTVGDSTARLLGAAVSHLAPAAVFSGDGGGETLGFLLMNVEAGKLLNDGKLHAAVKEYLKHNHVSKRVFKSTVYQQLRTVASDRMERELTSIGSEKVEKALHLLVLCNDLRCHLHEYFNRLQQTRVELLLPFYDRRVIASIMGVPPPLDTFVKHALYHSVVDLGPPVVRSVPWQTYPGHLACPTEDAAPPPNQWQPMRSGSTLAKVCLRMALSPGFVPLMRRSTVLCAALLHWAGLADYDYLFKTCINIQMLCGGGRAYIVRNRMLTHSARLSEAIKQ